MTDQDAQECQDGQEDQGDQEIKEVRITYFPTAFPKWNAEYASVADWCKGKGVDIGCGDRSIHDQMVRVDIRPEVAPDFVASADALPFEEGEFDFMWSSHNIEHTETPLATILEARRVVKQGGYLVYIIPHRTYTEGLDPTHKHEWTPGEYIRQYSSIPGLQLVAFGGAADKWSFHVVYQKIADEVEPDKTKTDDVIHQGLQTTAARNLSKTPLRLCSIGDHPGITTGLGLVHRQILGGFKAALFRINVLGCMETRQTRPGEFPYEIQPCCRHDFFGYEAANDFLRTYQPEVLFMVGDPGTITQRLQRIPLMGRKMKVVCYFPIEGTPIFDTYLQMIRSVKENGGKPITYTKWGAEQIAQASNDELQIDWVWHGCDHAPFRPFPRKHRAALRKAIGWDDKFVVTNISRNKRTNRHGAYLQAAKILKDEGYNDILWYLHCAPLDPLSREALGGMDLLQLRTYYDVEDVVLFPPLYGDQLHGVPYNTPRPPSWIHEAGVPQTADGRGALFASYSMIERLNSADLYIDASSAQGFNLPNVEAMACGLPIIVTADNGVRQEIVADAALSYFYPSTVDWWHNMAELHIVPPEEIAKKVRAAHDMRTLERDQWAKASHERSQLFRWADCQKKFVNAVKEVVLG